MSWRFQFRRDSAADWTAANPTLLDGEIGLETDTNKFKFGDGATAWTALGYASSIPETLFDADSILAATADDTPAALTLAEQTVVGRLTGGHPDDIAIGIADNNMVQIDSADAADDEYARFTANGLESRTKVEVATDLQSQFPQDITDNAVLTVDDAAAADDEFARFTADGIEGLTVAEAITALLGAALPENTAIILDAALSDDGKYSGIVETGTAGATLAFGDLVYLDGVAANNRWELTDANAEATTFGKLGICVLAAANDGSATAVLLWGKVRANTAFPDLTIGAPVYVSETAGDVVVTAPADAGDFVRVIGYGNTADELFFCPSQVWIERV